MSDDPFARNPRLHPSLKNAVSVPKDKSLWTPAFFRQYVFCGDVDGAIADMVDYVLASRKKPTPPSEQPIEQSA